MKKIWILVCFLSAAHLSAQKATIEYESHGKMEALYSQNPFAKFFGEWTLKNNDWTQNWGYGTEQIKIPNHHTISTGINTKNTVISIIDGPEPHGQIFWSYNPVTKEVGHLSSFGDIRAGKGSGTIDENGNLRLKLFFEGEVKNTYRIYTYTWINPNEYELKSVQYDENDQPTGLFYGGIFARLPKNNLKEEIAAILKVLDNHDISVEEQLQVYADDVVHMAPNNPAIENKQGLKSYLEEQRNYGTPKMTHKIISYEDLGETVILRGKVVGTFYPKNQGKSIPFETKNFFVFKRIQGKLKIASIIYNSSPIKSK